MRRKLVVTFAVPLRPWSWKSISDSWLSSRPWMAVSSSRIASVRLIRVNVSVLPVQNSSSTFADSDVQKPVARPPLPSPFRNS